MGTGSSAGRSPETCLSPSSPETPTSPGALQFVITPEKLAKPHESKPWNPIIANVFYRAGVIESWGRGTLKIRDLLAAAELPVPEFESEHGEVVVRFRPARVAAVPRPKRPTAEVTAEVLAYCQEPRRSSEIMILLGLRHWRTFQTNYLNPFLEAGLLARTVPDKPRSSKQRYTTTKRGAQWLVII